MSTAEEWGRLAVSLPGWRWMRGMTCVGEPVESSPYLSPITDEWLGWWEVSSSKYDVWVDPDDPATEGCMVRLLGPVFEAVWFTNDCDRWVVAVGEERRLYTSLGRACIAAAEALGRWPGDAYE